MEEKTQDPPTLTETIDALFAPFNRSDAPGLVVGVAHRGEMIYRRGFGLASLEHGVVNSLATRMRIGSTSKHFTCLAVLLLAEEGKVDVDAGIRTYVPELPSTLGDPTLRQLMSHQGGFHCYLDVGMLADGLAIKPTGHALASQVRQSAVNFPVGERAIYNNGGYHLLSIVVDRQSGMPYERFLEERIFQPLGMHDTRSVPSDLEIHRGLATLYMALPGGGHRRGLFPSEEVRGEGAMISTIGDMLTWLAHLRHPDRVGSAATWQQMTQRPKMNNGFESLYALGLMVESMRGVDVVHHAGGVMGGACQMLTVPEHELDIIIMTNGAPANPVELAEQIVDAVLGDALQPKAEPVKAADHPSLLGTFFSPKSGLIYQLGEGDEGKLTLASVGGPPIPVVRENGMLVVPFSKTAIGHVEIPLPAHAADTAAVRSLAIRDFGNEDLFERLPEVDPEASPLADGIGGVYDSPDNEGLATVTTDDDAIRLTIKGQFGSSALKLTALKDDLYTFAPDGGLIPLMGVVRFERIDGKVAGLVLDTGRTRGLRMHRR